LSTPQIVPVQTFGAAQSAAEVAIVQLALQTLFVVSQLNPPAHGVVAGDGAAQVPLPLHALASVSVEPALHAAAAHWVPVAYIWQAPEPLHEPFVPQLAAPASMQRAVGSGMPAGTAEQVPSLPATPHDWQSPVHAPAQQKPCAQIPELQSVPRVQVRPFGRLPQLVPLQTFGATQSAVDVAVVQAALQAPFVSH
jgi:hypothetical protein